MARPMGESKGAGHRVDLDRRLKLEFHDSIARSGAGSLAYRELEDVLGPTEVAAGLLQASYAGNNERHGMTGPFRQSVLGRLGGYEEVNDAVRLRLHALTYNWGTVMRTLALQRKVKHWSPTTQQEKLVKIGAKAVSHGRYLICQRVEGAIPRDLLGNIPRPIDRLRPKPVST